MDTTKRMIEEIRQAYLQGKYADVSALADRALVCIRQEAHAEYVLTEAQTSALLRLAAMIVPSACL